MTERSPVKKVLAQRTARTTANRRIASQDRANAALVTRQQEATARRNRVMRSRARMMRIRARTANVRLAAAPAQRPDQGGYQPQPYAPGPSDVIPCPVCALLNGADACICDQCGAMLEGNPDVVTDGPTAAQAAMMARHRAVTRR